MTADPTCGTRVPARTTAESKPRASKLEVPHRDWPEDRKSLSVSTLIRWPPRGSKNGENSGFIDQGFARGQREVNPREELQEV